MSVGSRPRRARRGLPWSGAGAWSGCDGIGVAAGEGSGRDRGDGRAGGRLGRLPEGVPGIGRRGGGEAWFSLAEGGGPGIGCWPRDRCGDGLWVEGAAGPLGCDGWVGPQAVSGSGEAGSRGGRPRSSVVGRGRDTPIGPPMPRVGGWCGERRGRCRPARSRCAAVVAGGVEGGRRRWGVRSRSARDEASVAGGVAGGPPRPGDHQLSTEWTRNGVRPIGGRLARFSGQILGVRSGGDPGWRSDGLDGRGVLRAGAEGAVAPRPAIDGGGGRRSPHQAAR